MADFVCLKCKYCGKPKRVKQGSAKMAVMAWLAFPFGLPYTLWRILSKKSVCRNCGSEFLVPANSPMGQRLLKIAEDSLLGIKQPAHNELVAEEPKPAAEEKKLEEPVIEPPEPEPEEPKIPKPPQDPNDW